MRIVDDIKLDFSDVLIVPKRAEQISRKVVNLQRTLRFKYSSQEWSGIPIMAANMDTVGTFEMARVLSNFDMLTCIHKHYSPEQWKEFLAQPNNAHGEPIMKNVVYSLGTSPEDVGRLFEVRRMTNFGWICLDVANGYSQHFLSHVEQVRSQFPNVRLIAGNVVTPEMTEALILAGADIVKVGIGGGSACTTRIKAGVGYPQLSAVIECADAAHGVKGHIISDGGCTVPGDLAKAFGGGADFVMLGGMLAGHKEAGQENMVYESEVIHTAMTLEERKTLVGVRFHGMSSKSAMEKHYGGVAEYRAAEGKEVIIPYRGSVDGTIQEILGGLRSACTYIGAASVKEVPKRTTFVKTYRQHNAIYDGLEK